MVHRSSTCTYSDDKNWLVVDNSAPSLTSAFNHAYYALIPLGLILGIVPFVANSPFMSFFYADPGNSIGYLTRIALTVQGKDFERARSRRKAAKSGTVCRR